MNTRILHCGESLENYYLCLERKLAGFKTLSPATGDMIYFSVKLDGISYIGGRGIIEKPSAEIPWRNAQNYKRSFSLTAVEYCKAFKIQPLSQFGGTYWAAKYLQSSKPIKDIEAIQFLEDQFTAAKMDTIQRF